MTIRQLLGIGLGKKASSLSLVKCHKGNRILERRSHGAKEVHSAVTANLITGLEILYIWGARLRAKKKFRSQKKKEEKRGERETKEKRGEEESKYGMKKVKRDQGKRKKAPVTPNQTKLLEPKKTGREKEKRKTRKVLEQKKRR